MPRDYLSKKEFMSNPKEKPPDIDQLKKQCEETMRDHEVIYHLGLLEYYLIDPRSNEQASDEQIR